MPAVLDVRSQTQYQSGHAAGAYNIPFDELKDRGFEMPSHATPLVVEWGRERSTSGAAAAAMPPYYAVGTASTSSAPWIEMEEP